MRAATKERKENSLSFELSVEDEVKNDSVSLCWQQAWMAHVCLSLLSSSTRHNM